MVRPGISNAGTVVLYDEFSLVEFAPTEFVVSGPNSDGMLLTGTAHIG